MEINGCEKRTFELKPRYSTKLANIIKGKHLSRKEFEKEVG